MNPYGFQERCSISEDEQELLSTELVDENFHSPIKRKHKNTGRNLLVLNLILLFVSLFILAFSLKRNVAFTSGNLFNSTPASILDSSLLSRSPKRMDGALVNSQPPIIYRQTPSPAVDAAWARLANVTPIAISHTALLDLGKDPSTAAKYPPDFGLGDDAYIARFDVFHQLHCLNTIRKEMFPSYYHSPSGSSPDTDDDARKAELHQTHVSHCLYILLEKITCDVDLDVITHYWTDIPGFAPYPDFYLQKQCRSFEDVVAWQERNSVSLERFGMLKGPGEGEVTVMSDEFKALWGY